MNPIEKVLIDLFPVVDDSDERAKMAAVFDQMPADILEILNREMVEKRAQAIKVPVLAGEKEKTATTIEGHLFPQEKTELPVTEGKIGDLLKQIQVKAPFGKRKESAVSPQAEKLASVLQTAINAAANMPADMRQAVIKTAASELKKVVK